MVKDTTKVEEKPKKTAEVVTEQKKETTKSKGKYTYAIGRRKSASVKVKIFENGKGAFKINGRDFDEYFKTPGERQTATASLVLLSLDKKVDIEASATGGGLKGQAEAIKLAISRALVKIDADNKPSLKEHGFMRVDARKKERKKPGLKGARRAPQWRKR